MHVLTKFLLLCVTFSISENSAAYQELPFCPGGGPPGWMNYFDHKRNQNIWRHHNQLNAYYPPARPYANQYRQFSPHPSDKTQRHVKPRSNAARPFTDKNVRPPMRRPVHPRLPLYPQR